MMATMAMVMVMRRSEQLSPWFDVMSSCLLHVLTTLNFVSPVREGPGELQEVPQVPPAE